MALAATELGCVAGLALGDEVWVAVAEGVVSPSSPSSSFVSSSQYQSLDIINFTATYKRLLGKMQS